MSTLVLQIDPQAPDASTLARAAAVLRAGGLVAFPTETVYGLGANALEAAAVGRIFEAKGRPADNPIIVHIADVEQVHQVASDWPALAQRLAERFWPGPLTLVLPRRPEVPDIVTAGGPTVAVRLPAHPLALALIRAAGVPLAAPSANRSGYISPTRAEHVLRGLAGRIDLLLDGGPTPGGLESTVLNLTTTPPTLLRPGLLSAADIEAVIRPLAVAGKSAGPLASPGLLPKHYAPGTPLECVTADASRVDELARQGLRVGWLTFADRPPAPAARRIDLPAQPAGYAAQFYDTLHRLDQAGVDRIVVARPPDGPEWQAIHDRLRRAAN
jgi:L-threonylcarbamoyladenylate synthase